MLSLMFILGCLGGVVVVLVLVSCIFSKNTPRKPVDFSKFARDQPKPYFDRGVYQGAQGSGGKDSFNRNQNPSKRGPSYILDAMNMIDAIQQPKPGHPNQFQVDPRIEQRVIRNTRYSFAPEE